MRAAGNHPFTGKEAKSSKERRQGRLQGHHLQTFFENLSRQYVNSWRRFTLTILPFLHKIRPLPPPFRVGCPWSPVFFLQYCYLAFLDFPEDRSIKCFKCFLNIWNNIHIHNQDATTTSLEMGGVKEENEAQQMKKMKPFPTSDREKEHSQFLIIQPVQQQK